MAFRLITRMTTYCFWDRWSSLPVPPTCRDGPRSAAQWLQLWGRLLQWESSPRCVRWTACCHPLPAARCPLPSPPGLREAPAQGVSRGTQSARKSMPARWCRDAGAGHVAPEALTLWNQSSPSCPASDDARDRASPPTEPQRPPSAAGRGSSKLRGSRRRRPPPR